MISEEYNLGVFWLFPYNLFTDLLKIVNCMTVAATITLRLNKKYGVALTQLSLTWHYGRGTFIYQPLHYYLDFILYLNALILILCHFLTRCPYCAIRLVSTRK